MITPVKIQEAEKPRLKRPVERREDKKEPDNKPIHNETLIDITNTSENGVKESKELPPINEEDNNEAVSEDKDAEILTENAQKSQDHDEDKPNEDLTLPEDSKGKENVE